MAVPNCYVTVSAINRYSESTIQLQHAAWSGTSLHSLWCRQTICAKMLRGREGGREGGRGPSQAQFKIGFAVEALVVTLYCTGVQL